MKTEGLKMIGKAIIVEGVKSVTLSAGLAVTVTLFSKGFEAVKDLDVKDLL